MTRPAFFSGLAMMALGLGLVVAALYFLPICHGDHPMQCFWMTRAIGVVGFAIGLSGVMLQFLERQRAVGVQMMNVLLGLVVVALATFAIGPCPNPMMACHAVTGKVLTLWGVLVAVAAAMDAWRLSRG